MNEAPKTNLLEKFVYRWWPAIVMFGISGLVTRSAATLYVCESISMESWVVNWMAIILSSFAMLVSLGGVRLLRRSGERYEWWKIVLVVGLIVLCVVVDFILSYMYALCMYYDAGGLTCHLGKLQIFMSIRFLLLIQNLFMMRFFVLCAVVAWMCARMRRDLSNFS